MPWESWKYFCCPACFHLLPPTRPPAWAELINNTYWAYRLNPPLLQVIEWTERANRINTKDSIHMPSPWNLKGPSHPEEVKLISISLGYEVLPLCIGPAKLCINISWQTWAFALPPKEDFRTLLRLFTALSLSANHVYTTETLGKELGTNKEHHPNGLLIKTLNILWFVGTNIRPNQEN